MVSTTHDPELLRRYAAKGDEAAFGELVRRYIGLVYHAALRQLGGNAHLAEDVAQKVFTLVARRARFLAEHGSLAGWLHGATRNVARDVARAERRRRLREREACLMHERTSDDPSVDWEKLRPVLDEAIGQLGPTDREAVLLRFFAQLPHAQVAQRLNLSENAARMRVERALEKLQAWLKRRGVESTAGALAVVLGNQGALAAPAHLATSVAGGALTGATAAGGSGALADFFAFMSTFKTSGTIVAGVALIVALGTATHQTRARLLADEELALARREQAVAAAKLGEERRRAETAEQDAAQEEQRVAAERAASQAAIAAQAAAAASSAQAAANDPVAAGNAFMARHPEVKQAINQYGRGRVWFGYRELFEQLQLSPDQIERFIAFQNYGMGASLGDGKSVSLLAGNADWGPDRGRQLREALGGEEGYLKAMEYRRTVDARELVVKVAGALYFSDAPLTPQQADQLVPFIKDGRAMNREWRPQLYDWDAIMTKASGVLSAPQLQALAALQARDRFHQALNQPLPEPAKPAK